MNHFRLRLLAPFLAIAVAASTFAPVRAEEKVAPDAAENQLHHPYVISINFPGGPMSKLVASLNAEGESRLSIIQSPGVDPVLPAFSVSHAQVEWVIAALGQIVGPQGYLLRPVGPNVAVLSEIPKPEQGQGFASFQLGPKIGNGPADEVINAIKAGCEFASSGKSSTLRIKYHPGTKLLFVSGDRGEIAVARQIFDSLPDVSPPAPPTAPDKK